MEKTTDKHQDDERVPAEERDDEPATAADDSAGEPAPEEAPSTPSTPITPDPKNTSAPATHLPSTFGFRDTLVAALVCGALAGIVTATVELIGNWSAFAQFTAGT